jgi:Flp pilus assembly protein TadD
MAQANAGKLDEAIVSFDQAIKINPQDPKAWNNKEWF